MLVILLLATWSDIRSYQVKNSLVLTGLLVGAICNCREYGLYGLVIWSTGVILPVILFGFLFILKMLGAGDIKLFAVTGAFLGITSLLYIIVLTLIIGGVMSACYMLYHHITKNRLQYLADYISDYLKTGIVKPYYDKATDGRKPVMHFTVAIFIGTCMYLCIWR